jgi:mRNA interferase HigB
VRVISKRTLREYWQIHTNCEQQLLGWYKEIRMQNYQNPNDVLASFANCRSIGANRYIFDIKGNSYRLVVKINFKLKTVWIRFIGTHAEYDKINALVI